MLSKMLKWTDAGNPGVMAPSTAQGIRALALFRAKQGTRVLKIPDEGDRRKILRQGWWACPFPQLHINSNEKRLYCDALQNGKCDL